MRLVKPKKFISSIVMIMFMLCLCTGQAFTAPAQNNGAGLDALNSSAPGLVIGGSGITGGAGLLGSFIYLSQDQVDDLKANKSVNGLGLGDSWTGPTLYSSYDNHGTPEYVYRLAEGINLKTALTALGVDVTSSPVALEATALAPDFYSKIVEDAFGKDASRNYIAPDGTVGSVVDPILVFYEDKVTTSDPGPDTVVPTVTTAIYDPSPTFVYGQKEATEQSNCNFVKGAVKIRVGLDTPAFTITQDSTVKSISLSDIALLGIYETSYSWDNGGTQITQSLKGVPLNVLLEKLGIAVPEEKGLVVNVNDGNGPAVSSRTIDYNEIGQCFVAFDAFQDDQRVSGSNTPLRLYCPGETQANVLIENVVGAAISDVAQGGGAPGDGKASGGDIANSVFYIAVKDAVSGEIQYYYYTKAELEAYETQEAYTYNDHGVIKTVTCKGALLSELLDDLQGAAITEDLVVQYAEEDGYHADAAVAVINSNYKDTIKSLTEPTLSGSGSTREPLRPIVTYEIHEEYANPDDYNVNDPEGVFKDADNHSGYLRVYRNTGDANSTVMKYMMGAVISAEGSLLSGNNGCVIKCVSDKNPAIKVRNDVTIKGLVPGMQYAVKAPRVTNASLASGQTSPELITVGSGAPAEQEITFEYTEDTYFYVKNAITGATTNYTYTDLIAMHEQVPEAGAPPYGYEKPMYYRYNGVWLSDLAGSLSGDYSVTLVGKDGTRIDITKDLGQYFAAYNNTQSKTSTNIPEGKRVTVTYVDAKVIIPSTGVNITGAGATDYTPAGRDVDVLMAAAEGLEITSLQPNEGKYTVEPVADESIYEVGETIHGIKTMTVKTGVTGLKYFGAQLTPVVEHEGQEAVVFTHLRGDIQLSINITRADFDIVDEAQAGFNVQAGDVVKAYIVDELTNSVDSNPTILQ
ncbi:MAG: hypothetical protein BWY65_01762 [Firmicutes bacterium ADurb.Bin373]|nr:MAG: hypothetical protein BWY65_01762 [Firmicutes bacterium ADurb.Bin373]